MSPTSIYIHIPFCRHRCGYCDFNTYAGLDNLIPAYSRALCQEIEYIGAAAGERLAVHTVFFGGGTPSLLPAEELENILAALQQVFALIPGAEISLEANPGTVSPAYLAEIRRLGINRLSLGVQSANLDELRLLERQHDFLDVIHAVRWARQAGFDNLSLDLIFGLPEQTLQSWQRTVELALGLRPEHLSLYALTLEHGTPLEHWAQRGLIPEPDADLGAEMYEWAAARLETAGYEQYEISNWARRDGERLLTCRHNLQYWRGLPYIGLGAGAHGYIAGQRTGNVLGPAAYIQRLSGGDQKAFSQKFPATPATQSLTRVDRQAEISEFMIMGLRLVQEGVAEAVFQERFGVSLGGLFGAQIQRLEKLGLLEWAGPSRGTLRLTQAGRLLGNQVFIEFID